ncbi:MAG TPA: lysylphosphatidylglycerol synthase transmembrane domain-containing protein [Thermotogota bacterium]|nr:lysylphosphatidylglycerol synthase transmembrane domain-containing protein [Thermotogota bacterium]HRW92070.1 lysylphosphatidylglycerol synthase transmembrane domain-containing protein [Thermotogota bacterium]
MQVWQNEKQRRYGRGLFLAVFFGVGVGAVFLVSTGLQESSSALLSYPLSFAILASGVAFCRFFLEACVLFLVVQPVQRIGFGYLLNVTFTVQFFNMVTPFFGGGQPVGIYLLVRKGVDLGRATALVLGKSMVFQVVFSLFALFGVLQSFGWLGKVAWGAGVTGVLFNASMVLLILFFGFTPRFARKLVRFCLKLLHRFHLVRDTEKTESLLLQKVELFTQGFSGLLRRPYRLLAMFAFSVAQVFLFVGSVLVVLRGVGFLPTPHLWTRSILMATSAAFVPTPGNAGGAEGMYALFFENVGNATQVSVSMIVWRSGTFYLAMMCTGILAALFFARQRKGLSGGMADGPEM